jgi:SET domain-containing protein
MKIETLSFIRPFELHGHLDRGDRLPFEASSLYVAFGDLGLGVFAARRIHEGTKIHTFSGPRITFSQVLAKGERQCWPLQVAPSDSTTAYVDLDDDAPGCFVNHSCAPNAVIVNDLDLVAITDIPPDVEVRFDYSTTMFERSFEMECRCGSPNCRGIVKDFDTLPIRTQEYYRRHRYLSSFIEPLVLR